MMYQKRMRVSLSFIIKWSYTQAVAGDRGADVWDLGRGGVHRVGVGVESLPPDVRRHI